MFAKRPIKQTSFLVFLASITAGLAGVPGELTREQWNGISGLSVSDLVNSNAYHLPADAVSTVSSTAMPTNVGENYGQRVRGYVIPPVSGEYTFWLAADNAARLSVSTSESKFDKQVVSEVYRYTPEQRWDWHRNGQQSAPVTLVAGQRYFVELLHKESSGSDHAGFAWSYTQATATNWAREAGAVATQGSTGWGGVPSRAIDGNKDGDFWAGSVSHTNTSALADAWWQVDLGQVRSIDRVVIWNRSDDYTDQLSNYRVSVLDQSGAVMATKDFYTTSDFTGAKELWDLDAPVTGSVVKVEMLGANRRGNHHLAMAEVEVFGRADTSGVYVGRQLIDPAHFESYTGDANDTDNDELPDDWEIEYFGDLTYDGSMDSDGDTLTDAFEFALGLKPNDVDSDDDGFEDWIGIPGYISYEAWLSVSGYTVENLTSSMNFRQLSTIDTYLPSTRTGEKNIGAHGARMRGRVVAPVSGDYRFWISSDDSAELYLGSGESKFTMRLIAWNDSWTSEEHWDKYATQRSEVVTLEAGQEYYIEALMKGAGGSDHLEIAWEYPGVTREVIPSLGLRSYVPEANDIDDDGLPDDWELSVGLDPADNGAINFGDGAYGDADSDGYLNREEWLLGSDPFVIGAIPGAYSRDLWLGITGPELSKLWMSSSFPSLPSSSGDVFDELGTVPSGDSYAQRIRGSITFPQTGTYTLWLSSDDSSELWLSDTGSRFGKRRVANVAHASSPAGYDQSESQQSTAFDVTAGVPQYFEILHKEDGGGEHLGLAYMWLPENVAAASNGATATQSSLYAVGSEASLAIDGNTSGSPTGGSFTHTADQPNSWLQVDFAQDQLINRVVLHNRDTNQIRLSNFRISVLDASGGELEGADFFTTSGNVGSQLTWDLPQAVTAKSVKVQLLGTNNQGNGILSVAELQAYHWTGNSGQRLPVVSDMLATLKPDANDGDDDSLPDDWELSVGLAPTNPNGTEGERGDPDSDGISNFLEYQHGTNPLVANSVPGHLSWDVWIGLSASNEIAALTRHSNFLEYPAERGLLKGVVTPSNYAECYGQRVRGCLTAPATGTYEFVVAADDHAQMWLSTDDTKFQKRQIIDVRAWVSPRQWTKYADQRSIAVDLVEGQKYFFEVYQKEGRNLDNLAIAWVPPGGSLELLPMDVIESFDGDVNDLDDDYLPDDWEVANGLDPLDNGKTWEHAGEYGDPDNDGLTNQHEYRLGTNPRDFDSDGDGMSDSFEALIIDAVLDDAIASDEQVLGSDDFDNDGATNFAEYIARTNPVGEGDLDLPGGGQSLGNLYKADGAVVVVNSLSLNDRGNGNDDAWQLNVNGVPVLQNHPNGTHKSDEGYSSPVESTTQPLYLHPGDEAVFEVRFVESFDKKNGESFWLVFDGSLMTGFENLLADGLIEITRAEGTSTGSSFISSLLNNLQAESGHAGGYWTFTIKISDDLDGDGLPLDLELQLGTDPNNPDHDGDGMPDGWEYDHGLDPLLNDADNDSDYDGTSNLYEYNHGSLPNDWDSDGNGVADGLEDLNGDGVADGDSDGDLLFDNWELEVFGDLDTADPAGDYDGDGLLNAEESVLGLNLGSGDTDGDLLPDAWEAQYGLDGTDPTGIHGKDGDFDGDGVSNLDEWIHGTDPTKVDTDGDDASDGDEIDRGANPVNPADGGKGPGADYLDEIEFEVGDPSGSHSERWRMIIKGTDPELDDREFKFASREFGKVDQKKFKLRVGAPYEVKLEHMASNAEEPDYDWQALAGGLPATKTKNPQDAGKSFILGEKGRWVVDNQQGLFGLVDDGFGAIDHTLGMTAQLLPIKVFADPGKIHLGFDPPNPAENDTPHEYWVSVPLGQVNDIVNIELGSDDLAGDFEMEVVDGDQFVTAAATPAPAFSAKKSDLSFTGTATNGDNIAEATVEVRHSRSAKVVATFKVMVLPKRTLTVSVYTLDDPNIDGDIVNSVPTSTTLIPVLNDVYRQAGIEFTWGGDSGPKPYPYDTRWIDLVDLKSPNYSDVRNDRTGVFEDENGKDVLDGGRDGIINEHEIRALFEFPDFTIEDGLSSAPPVYQKFENVGRKNLSNGALGYVILNKVELPYNGEVKNDGNLENDDPPFIRGGARGWVGAENLVTLDQLHLAIAHEIGHALGISTFDGDEHQHHTPPYSKEVAEDEPDGKSPASLKPGTAHGGNEHQTEPARVIMASGTPNADGTLPWLYGRWMRQEDWKAANENAPSSK